MPRPCANCLKESDKQMSVCSQCKKVHYCGRECQKLHWKTHKKVCTKSQKVVATPEHNHSEPPVPTKYLFPYDQLAQLCELDNEWRTNEAYRSDKVVIMDGPVPRIDTHVVTLNDTPRYLTTGLKNPDYSNLCFLNATLQCLFHTTPLKIYLYNGIHAFTRENSFAPTILCSILRNKFKFGDQHDASELLFYLLDELQKVCLDSSSLKSLSYHDCNTTFINQLFGGYSEESLQCDNCDHGSNSYQFWNHLPMKHATGTLDEGLDRSYCESELLDGYLCDGCDKSGTTHKSESIYLLPPILIFSVPSRQGTEVPETLNLAKYCVDENKDVLYELYAAIIHVGTQHFGHYAAVIKADDQWALFNDDRVGLGDLAFSKHVYVALYRRMRPVKPVIVVPDIGEVVTKIVNDKDMLVIVPILNAERKDLDIKMDCESFDVIVHGSLIHTVYLPHNIIVDEVVVKWDKKKGVLIVRGPIDINDKS